MSDSGFWTALDGRRRMTLLAKQRGEPLDTKEREELAALEARLEAMSPRAPDIAPVLDRIDADMKRADAAIAASKALRDALDGERHD